MPNRILRDGILSSESVCSLTWPAEVFYRRLMSVADDHGRFSSVPKLLRAACYPLQIDKVSDADIGKWLTECVTAALVSVYPAADGKRYLQILKFGQQVRSVSKYPGPIASAEKENPYERDIEALLHAHIERTGEFFGLQVKSARRQVRIGESYIDMLLDTNKGPCIVELKRGSVTDKALEQVCRYVSAIDGSFGVLVGAVIGPRMSKSDAADAGVAIATFTEDLVFSVAVTSTHVCSCDFTLKQVKTSEHLGVFEVGGVGEGVIEGVIEGGKRARAQTPPKPESVSDQVWADWLSLRKAKRAPVTQTVVDAAEAEAVKAGMAFEEFLRVWCARGSQGLQADWLKPEERPNRSAAVSDEPEWRRIQRERNEAFAGPAAVRRTPDFIDMEATDAATKALR